MNVFPSDTLCVLEIFLVARQRSQSSGAVDFFQSSHSPIALGPILWLGIEMGLLIVCGHADTGHRVFWDWENGCKFHGTYRSTISPLSFSILAGLVLRF